MPKRRRHQPGKYKSPPFVPEPNFTGPKPLSVFQAENGKWGVKDGEGNIVFKPIYNLGKQTEEEKANNTYILGNESEVFSVTSDDWDLISFICLD